MKNQKLNKFKEMLRSAMIDNFERDGFLVPMMFFYKDDMPIFGQVPNELLGSNIGKTILAGLIRKICQEPNVLAAGLIIEANGAKIDEDDEESKKVLSGEMRVSEMKDKQDIIVMVFSTPEEQELIAYCVDCDNKKVGELFGGEVMKQISGTFSDFFKWNKN